MHPTVVIDASVWVSRLMTQEVNHTATILWLESYRKNGGLLVAPDFLIVEVAAGLARRTGQSALAKQSIRYLLHHGPIHITPLDSPLLREAARLAADLRMRAGDAIYVALAYRTSAPLVSWDREQLTRAAPLIETYTPDSYPF